MRVEQRFVITGASGFIGRELVGYLASRGHEVLGIVRDSGRAESLGVPTLVRDLETVDSLDDVLRPGDTLVHLAARVHVMHDRSADPDAAFHAANVAPLRMIALSAARMRLRRLVFVSSAKVYGEGRDEPYTLADPLKPSDAYARSKVLAEDVIRQVGEESALPWTILRPPFVYGPGGKGNFPRLLSLARLGGRVPLPLGGIRNARSMIFVGNLVDAIARCALDSRAEGRVYLPCDSRSVSTSELLQRIGQLSGRPVRLAHVPLAFLELLGRLSGRAQEIERLTTSFLLDGSQLETDLGWHAPFDLDEALSRSMSLSRSTSEA